MELSSYDATEVAKILKSLDGTSGFFSGEVELPDWGFKFRIDYSEVRDAHEASGFNFNSEE